MECTSRQKKREAGTWMDRQMGTLGQAGHKDGQRGHMDKDGPTDRSGTQLGRTGTLRSRQGK